MRLFISINLDDHMCDAVSAVRRDMERLGVRGNFTRRENLHLTLAFIGEYPDPDHVADVMESVTMAVPGWSRNRIAEIMAMSRFRFSSFPSGSTPATTSSTPA